MKRIAPRTTNFVIVSVGLLFGCSEEPEGRSETTPTYTAPLVTVSAPTQRASVEQHEDPPYFYSPVGKLDPFRSRLPEPVPLWPDADDLPVGGGLEQWDWEQLHLQATITATSSPMAMVVDPNGEGHVVRRGSIVGRNRGRVTAISSECIVITELLRAADGVVTMHPRHSCLTRSDAL